MISGGKKDENSRHFDINIIAGIPNDGIDLFANSTIALVHHQSSSGSLEHLVEMITHYCK